MLRNAINQKTFFPSISKIKRTREHKTDLEYPIEFEFGRKFQLLLE